MSRLALDAETVPVTVLTGFLGSGKTTLLGHLLGHPAMEETAVIVNEFGEVGLDHHLLESSEEDTLLLDNGCLCCGLRGDLVTTLLSLLERRERAEVAPFRRVVIETTGLADPVPILQSFFADPLRLSLYRLDGTVTCVDAVSGTTTLTRHAEAERQVALAETVVVTKTDLADPAPVRAELMRRNPRAALVEARHGEVEPGQVLAAARPGVVPPPDDSPGHDHHHHHHDRITSVALRGEGPLAWEHVRRAIGELVERHGERLLRVKGLLQVEGFDGPVVVDGVQHVFHRPRPLERWPGGTVAPFLVGIGEGATAAELRDWLGAVLTPQDRTIHR